MSIGNASRSGPKIGVGHAEGRIGSGGKHMYGDSLGPGASAGKPRSAYWLKYPSTTTTTTTTTTSSSSSSSSSTTTTTTAA